MKSALPWFLAVVVTYVVLIVGAVLLIPMPWTPVVVGVLLVMAARFVLIIRKVSRLGARNGARPLK